MTRRVRDILNEAISWPHFAEHRDEILEAYAAQPVIFDNLVDLRIAYATVMPRHYDIDWRAACGLKCTS